MRLLLLFCAILVASVFLFSLQGNLLKADSPAKANGTRWEYAEFGTGWVNIAGANVTNLYLPGTGYLADVKTPEAMYAKLGGAKIDRRILTMDILNLLGQDGWEVIEIRQHKDKTEDMTNYFLKRPAK